MSKHIEAAPMPLIKRKLWLQTRQIDVEQAIERFDNQDIPVEWREELELLKIEIDQC